MKRQDFKILPIRIGGSWRIPFEKFSSSVLFWIQVYKCSLMSTSTPEQKMCFKETNIN